MEKENSEAAAPQRPALGLGLKRKAFSAPRFNDPMKKSQQPGSKAAVGAAGVTPPAAAAGGGSSVLPVVDSHYFTVLYCKYQPAKKMRKNKSFADGVLEIKPGGKGMLYDGDGKVTGQSQLKGYNVERLGEGSEVILGNWEIEVCEALPAAKFQSGEAFLRSTNVTATAPPVATAAGPAAAGGANGFRAPGGSRGGVHLPGITGGSAFRPPGGRPAGAAPEVPRPLHDPQAAGAVVLNAEQWQGGMGVLQGGRPACPVVIDPYLGRHLRPHQVAGVRFLYETVMGLREQGRSGCILADEMGLGKTLQVLTLIWTLTKQGPQGRPAVRKALVVTPSSLTQNWSDETRKWLGDERMRCMVLSSGSEGKEQVNTFVHGQVWRLASVSYETLRKHAAALAGCIDLLVCDEGHRLKSAAGNKTISALTSLNCPRRILLTGTPIQNNLGEFYAMVDFVCPGLLGDYRQFERLYGGAIARGRDKNASAEERQLGEARSEQLNKMVQAFILRRTADVNAKYLPPLSLYVVFCHPTPAQLRLYSAVLGSSSVRRLLNTTGSDFGDQALSVLQSLRKICNHPSLYTPDEETAQRISNAGHEIEDAGEDGGSSSVTDFDPTQSGKMATLAVLLQHILELQGDRCVVVSQSTAALDLVQKLCDLHSWKTVRIDGATDVNKRQDVVTSFNRHGVGQVFLLSTTAGGAGLNLVGANRLVLLDSHWNPAMDQQAMARIWRDGQAKPCTVYRLLTTGTIDEKMYQRQRQKGDLAATMMAKQGGSAGGSKGAKAGGQFSRDELKRLFTLNLDTKCDTYDLLQGAVVSGGGQGRPQQQAVQQQQQGAEDFKDVSGSCEDTPLAAVVQAGLVSFVHLDQAKQLQAQAEQQEQQQQQQQQAGGRHSSSEPEGAEELEVDDEEGGL